MPLSNLAMEKMTSYTFCQLVATVKSGLLEVNKQKLL